jgi:hypothetical protein
VTSPASGRGSCPDEFSVERHERQECNPEICPADASQIQCSDDQDIIFLLDGSGSILPHEEGVAEDAQFNMEKDFVQTIITNSALAGTTSTGAQTSGVRFGIAVYGHANRPQIASMLSGDGQALSTALTSAEWPKGEAYVSRALTVALQMLELATSDGEPERPAKVVLVTDGRMKSPIPAISAGKHLKDIGAKVYVVLVQEEGDTYAPLAEDVFCSLASSPCQDYVIRFNQWSDLASQVTRFQSALCAESGSGTIGGVQMSTADDASGDDDDDDQVSQNE